MFVCALNSRSHLYNQHNKRRMRQRYQRGNAEEDDDKHKIEYLIYIYFMPSNPEIVFHDNGIHSTILFNKY